MIYEFLRSIDVYLHLLECTQAAHYTTESVNWQKLANYDFLWNQLQYTEVNIHLININIKFRSYFYNKEKRVLFERQ